MYLDKWCASYILLSAESDLDITGGDALNLAAQFSGMQKASWYEKVAGLNASQPQPQPQSSNQTAAAVRSRARPQKNASLQASGHHLPAVSELPASFQDPPANHVIVMWLTIHDPPKEASAS